METRVTAAQHYFGSLRCRSGSLLYPYARWFLSGRDWPLSAFPVLKCGRKPSHELLIGLLFAASNVIALNAYAQKLPVVIVRELDVASRRSAESFKSILDVRQLDNGAVLVNDASRRQLVVLDSTLKIRQILLDSIAVNGQGYGVRPSPTIPFLGDSILFVDDESQALLVIDPSGNVARIAAPPKPGHMQYLLRGTSATNRDGSLIYKGLFEAVSKRKADGTRGLPEFPDSAPIFRARFDTRVIDTIAVVRIQPPNVTRDTVDARGKPAYKITLNPLILIDEWTVSSKGTLIIVRGRDYHVDLIRSDGSRSSGSKLPFDFRNLSDSDKQHIVDSVLLVDKEQRASRGSADSRSSAGRSSVSPELFVDFVPFSEIPDYYPPIRAGAVKADADGFVWILPTTSGQSLNGELVYDVVDDNGGLVERVRMPRGRSLAGFGKGGIIYLMGRVGNEWYLERTKRMK